MSFVYDDAQKVKLFERSVVNLLRSKATAVSDPGGTDIGTLATGSNISLAPSLKRSSAVRKHYGIHSNTLSSSPSLASCSNLVLLKRTIS
jgi:hypothetical protein